MLPSREESFWTRNTHFHGLHPHGSASEPDIPAGLPLFPATPCLFRFSFSIHTRGKHIHADELAQAIYHFQTSAHRPWTWLSLAWIAVVSPNAPAAPVSPGSSVPVAVVPSGSPVPAAGSSSGTGALATAPYPTFQLRRVGGKLTAAARSGSVTSFDLRNYLHKGLSPPAWGVFSLAFDLLFCKSNSAILASIMSFLIVLFLIPLILNICELLW